MLDVARPEPLAQPLGLRVEPGRRGDPLAEQPVDDDVDRRPGSAAGGPRRRGPAASGSSSLDQLRGDEVGQPGHALRGAPRRPVDPQPDVRVAALVAATARARCARAAALPGGAGRSAAAPARRRRGRPLAPPSLRPPCPGRSSAGPACSARRPRRRDAPRPAAARTHRWSRRRTTLLGDRGAGDVAGPVDAVRGGRGGRGGEGEAGVGRQRELDRGGGERLADDLRVGVADGHAEPAGRGLLGGGVLAVGAGQRPLDRRRRAGRPSAASICSRTQSALASMSSPTRTNSAVLRKPPRKFRQTLSVLGRRRTRGRRRSAPGRPRRRRARSCRGGWSRRGRGRPGPAPRTSAAR